MPLILYENQRLDARLKTVAVSGGRPRFSASGLGKHGARPPFELRLPQPDEVTGAREIAAWRSGVQLPLREAPWVLPNPGSNDRLTFDGAERSHFWLSVFHEHSHSLKSLNLCPPGLIGHWTSLTQV